MILESLRRHPVVSFFALAYGLSWAVWIPMAITGQVVRQGRGWPTHLPALFGPLVAAIVVTAATEGRTGIRDLIARVGRWRASPLWYFVALSPLAIFAITFGSLALIGRDRPALRDLERFSGLPEAGAIGVWALLVLAAVGEETGWRGFALPRMQRARSPLFTSVVIGILWAGWHIPSFFVIENYRTLGVVIFPAFAIGIASGSVLLTWLYNGSGSSVLLVSLWHGTYNLVSGTAAARGVSAAVVSAAVIIWALVLVRIDRKLHSGDGIVPRLDGVEPRRAA